ncbi:hypothetical protein [Gymnodinialimonas sp.]
MSEPQTKRWWAVTLGIPVLGLALVYEINSARSDVVDPREAIAAIAQSAIWETTGDGGRRGTAP